MTSQWGLVEKVVGIVTDNARNITNAVDSSDFELIRCNAHTLQLCVKDSLKFEVIEYLLEKSRKIVGHFKHSSKSTCKLRKIQETNDFSTNKFIQEVKNT